MSNHAVTYSVVRYLPDPIAQECINIGVVVIDGDAITTRFLKKWSRVKAFAGEQYNPDYLESFVVASATEWTIKDIHRFAYPDYPFQVELTVPQPSIEEPGVLLDRLVERYLKEPTS